MCKVLGNELLNGTEEITRDDITVGGNTIAEIILNQAVGLDELHRLNLKVSNNKIRILVADDQVMA